MGVKRPRVKSGLASLAVVIPGRYFVLAWALIEKDKIALSLERRPWLTNSKVELEIESQEDRFMFVSVDTKIPPV